jgi:hypothetical protein
MKPEEFLVQAGTLVACLCCMGAISFLSHAALQKVSAAVPSFTETADALTISTAEFSKKTT